jgi:cell division protein YceG involved in septum cleavage
MATGNGQQRTAQERERARAEREARRGRAAEPAAAVVEPAVEPAPEVEPALVREPAPEPEPAPVREPSAEREPAAASEPAASEPAPAPERMHAIPVKLPPPASLPPRLTPLGVPPRARRRRSRGGVVLLGIGVGALAALGWLIVFAVTHSQSKSKPVAPVAIVTVTIPEGETGAQIAQIAAAKGLTGSYARAARRSKLLDPRHYGAPPGTRTLEGFLFPATYEMYAAAPASRLVAAQLAAFEENFGAAQVRRARALHVTPYQLLIVASMVEREALLASDRPRVAAVIYNRLRLGMPLGIDSTIRYALHDFSKPLTEAQLHVDSPYNTRTHRGLPPTPISNPGLAAIDAAAHPAHVPYLYYVNGADGCGELVFSTGFAEFERNAAAYQHALARNGGRVPACRKR